MPEDLSPAAQFAAAAAAEAAASVAAVSVSGEAEAVADGALKHSGGEQAALSAAAALFESAADSAVGSDAESSSGRHARGKGGAIDLADTELFPSLGSAAKGSGGAAHTATAHTATAHTAASGKQQQQQQQQQQQRMTQVVDLPMTEGAVGETVRRIMEQTRAHIEVSHNRVGRMSTYLISGRREAVERAQRAVCAELAPQVTQVIQVPAAARGLVGGRAAAAVQEQTRTRVAVGRAATALRVGDGGGTFDVVDVHVTGDAAGVAAAVARLDAAADRATARRGERVGDVPREAHALLVGRGGETLRRLRAAHPQAQIHVPGPLSRDGAISVVGESRAACAACAAAVREAAAALLRAAHVTRVAVPKRQHQFVVGAGGRGLAEIAAATGCGVDVPAPGSADEHVTVRGPDAAACAAAAALVAARARATAVDAIDPADAHAAYARPGLYAARVLAYLADRGRLRRIEADHGVALRVPPPAQLHAALARGAGPRISVDITAADARAVAAARAALAALFAAFPPFHFNGIDVCPAVHAALAGPDGANVARLQAARSVYALLPPPGLAAVLVVYEGFSPDVARLPDAAAREAAVRALLRATLDELRAAAAAATDVWTGAVPPAVQRALDPRDPLLAGPAMRRGAAPDPDPDPESAAPSRYTAAALPPLAPGDVELRGLRPDVQRVAAELRRRADAAARLARRRAFSDRLPVPRHAVPHLAGRAGDAIRRAHDVTLEVEVEAVPSASAAAAPASASAHARLQGPRDAVAAAAAAVRALLDQLEDQTAETISVPAAIHPLLIGPAGRYARRLEEKYATRIRFAGSRRADSAPAADDGDAPLAPDQILIRGGRKGVAAAKAELLDLAAYELEHRHTLRFAVAAAAVPRIVGKAGARIAEIKAATGARIDLAEHDHHGPADVTTTVDVTVVGTRAAAEAARDAVQAIAAELDAQAEAVLDVPARHHRFLIGPGGARVRDLIRHAGGDPASCRVHFPRAAEPADWVRVKGDRAVVAALADRIAALVADRERMVTVPVPVPAAQHAFVIGRGGARLKDLQARYSVEIAVRRPAKKDAEDPDAVLVTGLPDDCAAAAAALRALVRDEATVTVPLALHRRLGGRGGSLWRRLRSELDVHADAARVDPAPPAAASEDHRPAEDAPDVVFRDPAAALAGLTADWVLRGEKPKLAQALALVDREIQAAAADAVAEARLRINPRLHRRIIGKQGATVIKIRDATACEITVPKRDSGSEWVVVSGPRSAIDLAIDLVNQAVEEHD
ncbi:hypothetical protein H4R18_005849 [Coemansia javaensis]|uniref:K Homology domain-containing protein n=1 Tax=Coemansia javaensis TaxID=2761396 RepID=A0A9W8H0M8_9FUNG|nr:hypothetical protein H4R18_005849 [Coemansia javaensis]